MAESGQSGSMKVREIHQQVADPQAKDMNSGHWSPGNLTIMHKLRNKT